MEQPFFCGMSLNIIKYVGFDEGYSGIFYIVHARENEENMSSSNLL